MDLAGKKVLVMGLGRSGRGAAALARDQGARVVGVDLRIGLAPIDGVVMELGPHRRERFEDADVIVVSPGIPPRQADLVAARAQGTPLIGELALAASFLDQPVAAVTGTNGKSTVTWFTGQLLRAAGHTPFVGGNLGTPLSEALDVEAGYDLVVAEVSSYQLELPGDLAPDVGVILNLSPDHLARHGDMESYARAKTALFAKQRPGQLAVLPAGDAQLLEAMPPHQGRLAWLGAHPGVVRDGDTAFIELEGVSCQMHLGDVPVLGEHNLDNAATAALLCVALGADPAGVQRGLAQLSALPHRMEPVLERDGVLWVNDSKATNLDAAKVGIGGLPRPAVVLLGGEAKEGSDFAELGPLLARHRGAVCFGQAGTMMAQQLATVGVVAHVVDTMAAAMTLASSLAQPGDAVLLSPGGASFDAFDDFEHRGRTFCDLVNGSSL